MKTPFFVETDSGLRVAREVKQDRNQQWYTKLHEPTNPELLAKRLLGEAAYRYEGGGMRIYMSSMLAQVFTAL